MGEGATSEVAGGALEVVQMGTMVRRGLGGQEVHEGAGTGVLRAGGLIPVTADHPGDASELVEGAVEVLSQELILGWGIGLTAVEAIDSTNVQGTSAGPGKACEEPSVVGMVLGDKVEGGGLADEDGHSASIFLLDEGGWEPDTSAVVPAGEGLGIGQALGRVAMFL